jgi:His-Xaa-Ser system radical SAM maturase HxsC
MIALHGRATDVDLRGPLDDELWRITDPVDRPTDLAPAALVVGTGSTLRDADDCLVLRRQGTPRLTGRPSIELPEELGHLSAGDIVGITTDGGRLSVLWRARSRQNFILLTEQCDNHCLMCSQPPRDRDDSWLLDRAHRLIELLPSDVSGFTITGGEPTLYGSDLVGFLRHVTTRLPDTEVHILSNGRRFAQESFALEYASVDNPRIMIGIPIYGAEAGTHDEVVQARGAFGETVSGILNLVRLDQRVEIRVVLEAHTAPQIVEIAEFISRNLPFVDQVALMGLELAGLARPNLDRVWVDPFDYRAGLAEAADLLDAAGIPVRIYNHQLCVLEPESWQFAIRSISDWKNRYFPECEGCAVQARCGGFFQSASLRRSAHLRPLHDADAHSPQP